LPKDDAPQPGQLFRNPDLGRTFRLIAEEGTDVFYKGEIGQNIVTALGELQGLLCLADIAEHASDWVSPIKADYRGFEVFEMPPNNQGLATLIALNVIGGFVVSDMEHNSKEYLHLLIEAMKLGLGEARSNVGDPDTSVQSDTLLSQKHAEEQRARISRKIAANVNPFADSQCGDTVYVAAVDEEGNVLSLISSLFKSFGSGITVPGTGVILQNRGSGFNLESDHPNRLGPGKRPYHTIMPGMVMQNNRPWACFGVVGGMMQAQGHLQVLCNLIDFYMDPQTALDAPRFRLLDDGRLGLEEGIDPQVRSELEAMGHQLRVASSEEGFGGGQAILLAEDTFYGGSDPRKDGCAIGF